MKDAGGRKKDEGNAGILPTRFFVGPKPSSE